MLAQTLPFIPVPANRKNVYAGGCPDGVYVCLMVSGWCLCVSDGVWIISGGVWGSISHKQLKRSRHIKPLPFLQVTCHGHKVLNFGVSVGCLEGVWKVSGGCLGDSGYCLVYWLSNKNHIWL